jgi:hypothetical protein
MSSKVLNHPDKEEIIKRLLEGESVKSVDEWLKSKYKRKKRLHISYMTLQKFRSDHLNIKGEILDEIRSRRSEMNKEETEAEAKFIIRNSSAYKQKIEEIASTELDVTRRLLEMDSLINSRIEYYYNLLDKGGTIKEDKIFLEYINTMKSLMQDWKKYIEGFADKKIEHNININVINEQAKILKGAVIDTLSEMSPELIPVFVRNLDNRMSDLDDYKNRQIETDIIDV